MKFFIKLLIVSAVLVHLAASNAVTYEMGEVERYKYKMWSYALNHNQLNQQDINNVLIDATFSGHKAIVELILNRTEGKLKPEKESVNKAFQRAFSTNNQEIMKLVVDLPISIRPDQNMINKAYDQSILHQNALMTNILVPYVQEDSP